MSIFSDDLMTQIRSRFAHVETCPIDGPRIFFESAGGALHLKSVAKVSEEFAAIPDNQGRDNSASTHLSAVIAKCKSETKNWLGATNGQVIVGESGTELLFRLISNACLAGEKPGSVVGTTLEHPASSSAAIRWAKIATLDYLAVEHDNETGVVTADDYAKVVRSDTRVATVVHTSPVTGKSTDLKAISAAIRKKAPDCFIIIDGIQHAAHGGIAVDDYDVDGYVISPYKVFSRHGYGMAWLSPRLSDVPHDGILGAPDNRWELGTRDTGAYATFSEVTGYFEWLGRQLGDNGTPRNAILTASKAISSHEKALTHAVLHGDGNLRGIADIKDVILVGGDSSHDREGVVSFAVPGTTAEDICNALKIRGIRAHTRKADHYSGNVLRPLGLPSCVRISLCHYNTMDEVRELLTAMQEIVSSD